MIDMRREDKDLDADQVVEQKHDLFNQLIHARDSNGALSEDELIGGSTSYPVALY